MAAVTLCPSTQVRGAPDIARIRGASSCVAARQRGPCVRCISSFRAYYDLFIGIYVMRAPRVLALLRAAVQSVGCRGFEFGQRAALCRQRPRILQGANLRLDD
jgi:hypothetical protein